MEKPALAMLFLAPNLALFFAQSHRYPQNVPFLLINVFMVWTKNTNNYFNKYQKNANYKNINARRRWLFSELTEAENWREKLGGGAGIVMQNLNNPSGGTRMS